MPTTTPTRVARACTRTCLGASVGTLMVTMGQAARLWESRPRLTMMVFAIMLAIAAVSGMASVLARCHLSIAQAFSAGAKVGASAAPPPARAEPRPLRVVVD